MKEIGLEYKSIRENNGLSLEEVSNDIQLSKEDLYNFEDGNVQFFEDIFKIKDIIELLSKYYSIDSKENIAKFNTFLYDFTSRIPQTEVEKENTKIIEVSEFKKVVSPYTHHIKKKNRTLLYLIILVAIIIIYIGYSILMGGA